MCKGVLTLTLVASLGGAHAARAELGDPTRPPQMSVASFETPITAAGAPIRVSSILISPSRQLAVINGERVKAGDMVGDARVLEILPYAVWLETDEGDLEVRISAQPVKVAVSDNSGDAK